MGSVARLLVSRVSKTISDVCSLGPPGFAFGRPLEAFSSGTPAFVGWAHLVARLPDCRAFPKNLAGRSSRTFAPARTGRVGALYRPAPPIAAWGFRLRCCLIPVPSIQTIRTCGFASARWGRIPGAHAVRFDSALSGIRLVDRLPVSSAASCRWSVRALGRPEPVGLDGPGRGRSPPGGFGAFAPARGAAVSAFSCSGLAGAAASRS